jgi:hypothetical protein
MHFTYHARQFIYISLLIQNFSMYYGAREVDIPPNLSITGRDTIGFTSEWYNPYISGQFVNTCEHTSIYSGLTEAKDSVKVILIKVLPLLIVNVRNYYCNQETK